MVPPAKSSGGVRQPMRGQAVTNASSDRRTAGHSLRWASRHASKVSAANQHVARPSIDVPVLRARCPPAVAPHHNVGRAARRAGYQQAQEQLPPGAQVPAKPHVCAGPNVNTTELPGRGGAKIQELGKAATGTHTRGARHKAHWPYGCLVSAVQQSQSGRAAHCVAGIGLPSTSPSSFAEARRRATTFEIYLPSPFHQACACQCHAHLGKLRCPTVQRQPAVSPQTR